MPKLATAGEGVRTGDCMLAPGKAEGARPWSMAGAHPRLIPNLRKPVILPGGSIGSPAHTVSLYPLKYTHFLYWILTRTPLRVQLRPPALPTPTAPVGLSWESALPVKAGFDFSSFCIPYKALASVTRFFSNPLNFKNRH